MEAILILIILTILQIPMMLPVVVKMPIIRVICQILMVMNRALLAGFSLQVRDKIPLLPMMIPMMAPMALVVIQIFRLVLVEMAVLIIHIPGMVETAEMAEMAEITETVGIIQGTHTLI